MQIPFATFREDTTDGTRYYIVEKSFPHWCGLVTYVPIEGKIAQSVAVQGYNLWVSFNGVLQGNYVPYVVNVDKDAQAALQRMAEWFLTERIEKNEKKYRKFKIVSDVPTTY